jgi:TonB family protein
VKMNMNSALIYRPRQRWQIGCAFTGAIVLHLVALALARSEPGLSSTTQSPAFDVPIEGVPAPPPPQPIDMSTPPPLTADQSITSEENPAPILQRSPRTIRPIARSAPISQRALTNAKAFALSAPRPAYPYEARRQHLTGSGIATLMIDQTTGRVRTVTMSQSTGSSILDNSTVSGLRQWRFGAGTPASVRVPITFTLTGATY